MKTQTQQMDKGKIDWEKANEFVEELFPRLQSDVKSSFGYVTKLEPLLIKEDFPPRIFLRFVKPGKESADLGKDDLSTEEIEELKKQQMNISGTVEEIAKNYGLRAFAGSLERGRPILHLGGYTFKPEYTQFSR